MAIARRHRSVVEKLRKIEMYPSTKRKSRFDVLKPVAVRVCRPGYGLRRIAALTPYEVCHDAHFSVAWSTSRFVLFGRGAFPTFA
jgi:hypothetical protein